jgi:hypothetical protein
VVEAAVLIPQVYQVVLEVAVVCLPQEQLLEALETLHQHHHHKVTMVVSEED